MPRRRSDIDRKLNALYEQVPELDCKGLCHHSCGPIRMSARERQRLAQAGHKVTDHQTMVAKAANDPANADDHLTCDLLDPDTRKCRAYELRPMICRVWGSSDALPCPYGCAPKDGQPRLTEAQTANLVDATMKSGGESIDLRTKSPAISAFTLRPDATATPHSTAVAQALLIRTITGDGRVLQAEAATADLPRNTTALKRYGALGDRADQNRR